MTCWNVGRYGYCLIIHNNGNPALVQSCGSQIKGSLLYAYIVVGQFSVQIVHVHCQLQGAAENKSDNNQ